VRELPESIARLTRRVAGLQQDMATLEAHASDDIAIGDQLYAEEDAAKALAKRLNSIPDAVHETRRVPLGMYRGARLWCHPPYLSALSQKSESW
jgi:cell division protein FtsB